MRFVSAMFLAAFALFWSCSVVMSLVSGADTKNELISGDYEKLFRYSFVAHAESKTNNNDKSNNARQLQQFPPCNEVIETLTVEQLKTLLEALIDQSTAPGSFENIALRLTFLSRLNYGVEIRRSCAACTDVTSDSPVFNEFCSSNDYGYDIPYSGLVMIPVTPEGTLPPEKTFKGVITMHPTTTIDVPSGSWSPQNRGTTTFFFVAVASIGSIVIAPDYMGYAESASTSFKGYLIRKAYETSVVPLWLQTKEIVSKQSDCQTALADATMVIGYSEGGYSSIVIADVLHRMGIEIISVQSGGGPLRMASTAILAVIEGIDNGTYQQRQLYNLAILGTSYSSTYPDVLNYQTGQDLLRADVRDDIVNLVTTGIPTTELNDEIPKDDPLTIFTPDLVAFARNAIATEMLDPCRTIDNLEEINLDTLCAALLQNDLLETVHNAQYPIDICHSPEDEVVGFDNTPDFDVNPDFVTLVTVTGTHSSAGTNCFLTAWTFAASDAFQNYQVADLHTSNGCPVDASMTPSQSPTMQPSMPPTVLQPTMSPPTPPTPTSTPVASPPATTDTTDTSSSANNIHCRNNNSNVIFSQQIMIIMAMTLLSLLF